jgi:AcrR family transcriptional regulator
MLSEDQKSLSPYHHGNVKEALIDVAIKLMEDDQVDRISLRRLSKDVGITPSAVNNHFADKNALMMAIKTRVYQQFNQFFDSCVTETNEPEQALLEMCLAYYQYSKEQPARFNFLFGSVLPMECLTPEMAAVSGRCLVKVRKLVWRIYEKYQIPCTEIAVVNATLLVWSGLHGIVNLRNSGLIRAAVTYQDWPLDCALIEDEEVEQIVLSHVNNVVNGVLNSQRGESPH